VNAVAGLAGDMNRLDVAGREQFEPFFLEAARIQRIIRALIDACLGKDELRRAGAPFFAYPLIPEGEGPERGPDREDLPPSSAQNIVNITLNSLQAGSLAGSLGEAFSGFASQAAALADIYSPIPPPGGTHGTDLPRGKLSGPPSPETAGGRPGKVTGRADSATVLERLSRSASVLHTLESVRMDLTRTFFSQKSTVNSILVPESRIQPGTLSPYSQEGGLQPLPAQAEHYLEPLGTMFTPLHGMLQKSERIAEIPPPETVVMGHPPLPQVPGPGIEMPGSVYPATAQRSAGAPVEARWAPVAPDVTDPQRETSRRSTGIPGPAPGKGIIEIPALVPGGVKDLRSEMATVNAARLGEGIARLSEGGTAQTVIPLSPGGKPQAAMRLPRGADPSLPAISVPDAFEKIAQYLTYSTDIHQQLMGPLSGGITGSGPGIFSVPLQFVVSEGGGGFSPGLILQGKDIRPAQDNPVMNLAVSMVAGEVMQRAHLFPHSAAGNMRIPGISSGSSVPGAVPLSSLYSLEHALPLYAGSRGETAPPAMGGNNQVHFQNTFNITVTTTAKGDERELRELGRKIGVILPDEMKRYGGFR
jgi:hypothetical protein